jgi:Sodium Bile acid symporter family
MRRLLSSLTNLYPLWLLGYTLFAFVTTPLWCHLLAGHYVPVDALGLCLSTLKAVVAPVLLGVFCNWKLPGFVAKAAPFVLFISVIAAWCRRHPMGEAASAESGLLRS